MRMSVSNLENHGFYFTVISALNGAAGLKCLRRVMFVGVCEMLKQACLLRSFPLYHIIFY